MSTHTHVLADRLFDGRQWRSRVVMSIADGRVATLEDGVLDSAVPRGARQVEWVVPALVDTHLRIYGYSETPGEDPLAPEGRVLDMYGTYGVGYVIDVELDRARVSRLQRSHSDTARPRLFGAGPCLSRCGRSRFDLTVGASIDPGDADAVRQRVASSSFPAVSVCSCAREVLPSDWLGADRLFVRPCDATGLARWELRDGTVLWCCGRERVAVSTIEGLLSSPHAGLAADVLPFTAQLPGVASRASLLIAKRIGRKYMPPWMPDKAAPGVVAEAERRLAEEPTVIGTGASQPGAVPGLNVWVEMAHLERLGRSFEQALHAATGAAAHVFPAASGAGTITTGRPAVWLEGAGDCSTVAALQRGVRRVMSSTDRPSDPPGALQSVPMATNGASAR